MMVIPGLLVIRTELVFYGVQEWTLQTSKASKHSKQDLGI